MENCIFCKIIAGEIPCTKIYEDDNFISFMDIKPTTKGHCLIVPKEHRETILEENIEIGGKLFAIIQKIASATKESMEASGMNIGINIGSDAGQEIFHTHIHLIPRYKGDNLGQWPRQEGNMAELAIQAEKIINKLD